MSLPIQTFWLYNKNMQRIAAQESMNQFSVYRSSQATGNDVKKYISQLQVEIGAIHKERFNEKLVSGDANAMSELLKF